MTDVVLLDKEFVLFLSEDKIQAEIQRMADAIRADLIHEEVLFMPVLNGAFLFAADLLRKIGLNARVSFVKLASYQGTASTGVIKSLIGLDERISDKVVVILEDIIDSGTTLLNLITRLKKEGAKKILTAVLFLKEGSKPKMAEPDYTGFRIPDRFIVGYGLDYNGYGRNLRDVYVLKD